MAAATGPLCTAFLRVNGRPVIKWAPSAGPIYCVFRALEDFVVWQCWLQCDLHRGGWLHGLGLYSSTLHRGPGSPGPATTTHGVTQQALLHPLTHGTIHLSTTERYPWFIYSRMPYRMIYCPKLKQYIFSHDTIGSLFLELLVYVYGLCCLP